MLRSSGAYVFYKRVVLQNVGKFTEKQVCGSLFLIKLSLHLYLKGNPAHVFSCEFFKILGNTFFTEHVRATASDNMIEILAEIVNG